MHSIGDFVIFNGKGYLVAPTVDTLKPIMCTSGGDIIFLSEEDVKLKESDFVKVANKSELKSLKYVDVAVDVVDVVEGVEVEETPVKRAGRPRKN